MDVTAHSACSFPLRERGLDETFRVIAEAGFDKIDLLGRVPHFSVTDPDYDMDALAGRATNTALHWQISGRTAGGILSPIPRMSAAPR